MENPAFMQKPSDSDSSSSGRIFFKILNGQKLVFGSSSTTLDIKSGTCTKYSLWELIRDDSYYKIKNRGNGQYIILDDSVIKTNESSGDNGQWKIVPFPGLSVDECKVLQSTTGDEVPKVWANKSGKLVLDTSTTSDQVTEQANQLFRFAYADGKAS